MLDKYRREDDVNDDLEVYNQNESFDGLTIHSGHGVNQPLRVKGTTAVNNEFEDRLDASKLKLSVRETELFELIMTGQVKSVRKAAKIMKISQQMASKYWSRIRAKLT